MTMIGIPGSISDDAKRIQWIRGLDFSVPGTSSIAKTYRAEVRDGWLKALVSHDEVQPGRFLWHISVSHCDRDGVPDRCPNWDELKHAAYRLVHIDRPFALIFPRRSAPYVNVHDTCLHLWESEKDVDL